MAVEATSSKFFDELDNFVLEEEVVEPAEEGEAEALKETPSVRIILQQ